MKQDKVLFKIIGYTRELLIEIQNLSGENYKN